MQRHTRLGVPASRTGFRANHAKRAFGFVQICLHASHMLLLLPSLPPASNTKVPGRPGMEHTAMGRSCQSPLQGRKKNKESSIE